jgi:hypothetical protein
MFVTIHVATGAAISTLIANPLMSVPIAFGSHFALDAIPHWHDIVRGESFTKRTYKISTADFVVSIALTIFILVKTSNPNLLYGIIAASIMDSDAVWYPLAASRGWRKIWPKYVSIIHGEIQNETKSYWGIVTQLVIFLLSLYIIF